MLRILTKFLFFPHRAGALLGSALLWAPRAARRWWRDQNRYEEVVPERIRKLAEARGIPKPLRYIP